MRAILIDPKAETITEIDYSGNYKDIYDIIECSLYEVINIEDRNDIFVDEEGLMSDPKYFFVYSGYHQPLANKGLILGPEKGEKSTPCTLSLDFVKSKITFVKLSVERFETTSGETMHHGMKFNFIRTKPIFGPPKPVKDDNADTK